MFLLKIFFLSVVDALGIWAGVGFLFAENWTVLIGLIIGLLALNFALLSRRAYPLRYLLPALFPFFLMVVYPILYNMSLSFTNCGTGHRLSKEEVIAHFENQYYLPEGSERYTYQTFRNPEGNLILLLTSQTTGKSYLSRENVLEAVEMGYPRFIYEAGEVSQINGYRRLSRGELFQILGELQQLSLKRDGETIRLVSLNEFRTYKPQYRYDRKEETLTDLQTGIIYTPVEGTFASVEGETLQPGFTVPIGFQNFFEIIKNPQITRPFFRVFSWTFLYAFLCVVTAFTLGLALAMFLNDPYLKIRYFYRTILIVPYAIPAFISILMWGGMLNTDFGIVNYLLQNLFAFKIPWFQHPIWAKVALVLVNLWLGYPYMMIVCLGALQSIPRELYEAARIDGANSWHQFKEITFPLLLISIAPLLIGSFAFNFNNFNVIYLLTQGRPPIPGAQTLAGATDILVTYTYKLAFGTSGARYGFAAAISLIIFVIIGTISAVNFRFTRRLEQMGEEL